ncbi:IdeS/Mac family cysteine endopeptidase [Metamycoplasma neophronis]|uniref:Ig protease IdeS domain-containing protein n=1 Tax=Metamycoplasma neophronis TaxID=872983 RepID=A0ABY2Z4K3_9BACT|nr:IdeS/Mac family cysteine endopeptidase [Metamycoplasma neophronis]TPR54047.1 hypothetical protein FJR74_01225 [Metamycoplasma neophronis]
MRKSFKILLALVSMTTIPLATVSCYKNSKGEEDNTKNDNVIVNDVNGGNQNNIENQVGNDKNNTDHPNETSNPNLSNHYENQINSMLSVTNEKKKTLVNLIEIQRSQINDLKAQFENQKNSLNQLKSNIDLNSNASESRTQSINNIMQELSSITEDNKQDRKNNLSKSLELIKNSVLEFTQSNSNDLNLLSLVTENIDRNLSDLEHFLVNLNQQNNTLLNTFEELLNSLKTLKNNLNKINENDFNTLNNKYESWNSDLDTYQNRSQDKFNEFNTNASQYFIKINIVKDNLNVLNNKLNSIDQNISSIQNDVTQLKSEVDNTHSSSNIENGEGSTNPSNENSKPINSKHEIQPMFSLDKEITIRRGEKFNFDSIYTINQDYQATEPDRTFEAPGMLTVKGVNIPPFPGNDKVEKINPGKLYTKSPIGKWVTTGDLFDNGDITYYLFLDDEGNWFDSNKWYRVGNKYDDDEVPRPHGTGGGDDRSCWAAAASNIMQWWLQQNRKFIDKYYEMYPEDLLTLINGKNLLQAYDQKQYAPILDYLCDYFVDKSGFAIYGIEWLLSGYKDRNLSAAFENEEVGKQFKGFFPHLFNKSNVSDMGTYKKLAGGVNNVKQVFSDFIKEAFLNDNAVSFVITPSYGQYNHAVTLWGAEFDDEGYVKYLYYSDSDENDPDARRLSIIKRTEVMYSKDNRTMKMNNYPDSPDRERAWKYSWNISSVEKISSGFNIWKNWYENVAHAKDDAITVNVINPDALNVNKEGIYKIKYQATDIFGNTQTQVTKIIVE